MPQGAQAEIGVVVSQEQSILGSRGEHTVRLGKLLSGQIVQHYAEVGLVAARHMGAHRAVSTPH